MISFWVGWCYCRDPEPLAAGERIYTVLNLRQLWKQMETPTLAAKLGTTTHLSPLLLKARRLGLGPLELQNLAVQRGCRHYASGTESEGPSVLEGDFSNEELAVALLSTALPYDPHSIRCGAAMLGAQGHDPLRLARMAVLERCVISVRHVAEAGHRFEPENGFWTELLAALPGTPVPPSGVLPHPTRFVAMTGFTRRGRELIVCWQRPSPRRSATGHD